MLTNLVRELDDHDLSVLHTRNTQNGLVGVACVNPLHKKISPPGHFAISATSVECYGLSQMCFCLQLSSNGTARVWSGSLYQVKPTKYHGVRTLSDYSILIDYQ